MTLGVAVGVNVAVGVLLGVNVALGVLVGGTCAPLWIAITSRQSARMKVGVTPKPKSTARNGNARLLARGRGIANGQHHIEKRSKDQYDCQNKKYLFHFDSISLPANIRDNCQP